MKKEKFKESTLSFFKLDIIQELFFSAIGCGLFFLIYHFFPKQYWDETYRTTIILILGLSFFLIFILLNQIHSERGIFKIDYKRNIILFSILNFAGYLFIFYNSNWGYGGLAADNFYRTAYITRMYHSGYPQDFAYKGLSAFYSPFYWYCLALIAIIFQIPPYKMVRIGLLLSAYVMPIVLFEMWKKIYNKKLAFIITIISSIYLVNIYSPDHMIGALLIIPYIMYYFENCTNKEFLKKDYVYAGIIGSIAFTTYFYYFIIIPIYYLIALIQNKDNFRKNLKHFVYITLSLMIFSSWFWAPLAKDIIIIGFESHQNRYLQPSALHYPLLGYFGFNVWSFFTTLGIIYIIRRYRFSNDIKILGNLILSIHIAFLLGFFGILIRFPIMHERLNVISTYILMVSSSIFYFKFFYFVFNNHLLTRNNLNLDLFQIEIYLLISIMIVQYSVNLHYITTTNGYEAAKKGNSMHEQREIFEELDYEDKVFLTNEWRVAMFLPIYLYLLPNPYYSHPSALYNQRIEMLIELSECETPKEFHKKIFNNKFGPIDYFYLDLENNGTKLVLDVAIEKFPEAREYYEIEFKIELFQDNDLFEEIIIDGELIYRTKY